jgi:hypothetical protein
MSKPGVLLVTEDPFFIEEARSALGSDGIRMVACLGPAHSSCPLLEHGSCSIAEHVGVVLVDSPSTGAFSHHAFSIAAGEYAETLQSHHPSSRVLLSGAPVGHSGPTGEVICTEDRTQSLSLIRGLSKLEEKR